MKVKRLMASLLCGAIGAATLGLSGCGSAADSGMMDAANANAVAGGSSDLPVHSSCSRIICKEEENDA